MNVVLFRNRLALVGIFLASFLGASAQTVPAGYTVTSLSAPTSGGSVTQLTIDEANGDVYYQGQAGTGLWMIPAGGASTQVSTTYFGNSILATDVQYHNGNVYTYWFNAVRRSNVTGTNNTTNFSSPTPVGGNSGAAVIGNELYLTDGDDAYNGITVFNTTTSTFSGVPAGSGTLPTFSNESLEYCQATNTLYYGGTNGTTGDLYSVNLPFGNLTLVSTGTLLGYGNFAVDPFGQYAYTINGGIINRIDLITGVSTLFASGFSSFTGALAFGPASGGGYNLYLTGSGFGASGSIYMISGFGDNSALNFDGVNDYVVSGGNIGITGNQPRTLEYYGQLNNDYDHHVGWGSPTDNNSFGMYMTGGFLHFYCFGVTGTFDHNTGVAADGLYHHVAVTYDGTTVSTYVDGNPTPFPTAARNLNTTNGPVYIGVRTDLNASYSAGTFDEVRIWNRALCQGEILAHMSCQLTGTETGLVLYYDFNDGNPNGNNAGITTANDNSPSNNDGTLNGPFTLNGTASNWVDGIVTGSCAAFVAPVATPSSNSPVCTGNTINLSAAPVTGATYSWTGPNAFSSSLQNPTISTATLADAGTYSLTVTVTGCTSAVSTTSVVVNSTPATPTAANDGPVCVGETFNLSTPTVIGATYLWSGPNGFTSLDQNPVVTNATPLMTGTYSVTVTVAGCTSTAGTTNVTVNPTPATPTASSNTPVCTGNTINLSTPAVAGATYSWTGPNSFSSSDQNPSIANATLAMAGTYSVTVTVTGCTSAVGTATVVVNPTPGTPTPSSNTPVCVNSPINLTTGFVAGATYSWTGPNAFASTDQNPTFTATLAAAGTYSVTATALGCTSPVGTTAVVVKPIPFLTSTLTPAPICNSTLFNYNATATIPGTTFTWTRAAIGTINGGVAGSGTGGTIGEVLTNSSTAPVNVVYTITSTFDDCSNVQNVTVSVNPTPVLTSASSIADICSGSVANYNPTSSTAGTIFNWSRAAVTGISTTAANGTGDPNEVLVNTTSAPITVTYVYSVSINGCVSSTPYNVTVVVKPTPILSSPQTAGPICSGTLFTYTPSSPTSGTTFAWSRALVAGITNAASSGTAGISETLINTTSAPIDVTYVYTLTADGCVSIPYNVVVTINPTPSLSNAGAAPAICSNNTFSFVPLSPVSGSTFNWTRAAVAGISNAATSGTGNPNEVLVNTTIAPVTVTYVYIVSAGGCNSAPANVTVVVNPTPALTSTLSPAAICSGTTFSYTPTNNVAGTMSWSRAMVAGISNGAATGTDNPNETLTNTTATPVVVTYVYTVSANGCNSIPYNVTVTVNPTPTLSSPLTPAAICSNTPFSYVPTSITGGTVFNWSRAVVAGISNGAATGSGNPMETLVNTTTAPVTVTYVYTLTANGCVNTQNVTVVVNPTPVLNTPLTITAICNGGTANYAAASDITGATFSWTRAANPSINGGAGGSGTGNTISETLTNSTNSPVTVSYVFTITANGCNNTQTVTVVVNPTVTLTSSTAPPEICDNAVFSYVPTSNVMGATFAWTRAAVSGIANGAAIGTGNPNEALDNTSAAPVAVTYVYTVTANGCTSTFFNVTVMVNPSPVLTSTITPPSICNATTFSYVPTSSTTGTVFNWSRAAVTGIANASAAGTGNPNEVLTNTTANPVNVTYVYSLAANGCTNLTTYNVVVTVNPSPILTSTLAPVAICSGTTFNYTPTSTTTGADFAWSRAVVPGITNVAATGINDPAEVLFNSTNAAINVTYVYTVSINGCSSPAYNVVVSVKPQPALISITNPTPICNNTMFNYTPTSNVSGTTFAWTRAAVAGISNPASSGINNPAELLVNTSALPVTVTYVYTLSANGCVSAPINVDVVVNPTPALTSTLTPATICSGSTFNYTPTSPTPGTIFNWARASVAGISNTASSGTGNPAEILVNTTAAPINVTYVYTLSANSCTNPVTYSVVVTVSPSPTMSSSLTPAAICNNTAFSYVPTSSTIGATFAWSRASVIGISNGAATGTGNPNETLTNTTAAPVTVTYVYTVSANGCTNSTTYNVVVTVNPTPVLTSPLTMPAICGNTTFNYSPTSTTSGATFNWSRASVPGIANAAATGVGNPAEVLINNTTAPVTVTYVYTVSANGCSNPANYSVTVVVSPVPQMTSTVSPPAICNNATFNYTPTSNTTGTTFAWSRAAVAGISNTAASGTGNPAEALTNTTPDPINVTYVYTLSANGCTNTNTYNVVVTVNPTPELTSTLTPPAICHNSPFIYMPTSLTPGTTFGWTRAAVAGINGNTPGSGFGNPNEMLANSTDAPITVNYVYTLTANGCTNPATYTVSVVVNPLPILTSTLSPADMCDNTVFNYVPTSPTVGTVFTWSRAAVAGIANPMATGTGNPAELLTNTTPAPVDVTYVYVLSINGCNNPITYNVVVTVNPTPLLTTPLTLAPQCNNVLFSYTPASATIGTTFSWSRAAIAGIDNPAATGVNGISETLVNSSPDSIDVVYEYMLTANNCSHTELVTVRVYPTPVLTSTLTPAAICNNTNFSYTPTSLTGGTSFDWTRAAVANISNPAASGTGDPNEVLVNTGTDTVHVTYIYMLSANGCNNDTPYHVVVVVNPTPQLTSTLAPAAICDSTVFDYAPTSLTPGTAFDWTRAAVAGIANATGSGTGNPMETLDNQTADPITVTYVYTLTANGCTNPATYSVEVVVNPTPYLNTTLTPAAICNNTVFNYTPGSNTLGATFAWSRAAITGISNAAATGTDDPNETLENTTTAPIDVVYEYTMTANGCSHTQLVTVTVYPSVTIADAGTDIGPLNATATLLNANQPVVGTGNWSFASGPNTPVIVDPSLFNTEVNTLIPGVYTFVWTVTSPWNCPGSTDTMQVIINVPPVANDDSATTNVNTAVLIDVTDNDTDADGTIDVTTVTIISYPSNGTVVVSGVTGNVLYTPNTNFIGLDNFTYTVEDNDNGVSNIANVVVAVYERPNAIDDDTMTMTNVPVAINVLANDLEGSGALDPTTVVVVNDVTNGITMVDPTTGVVTYTPANGYYGTDHFTYYMRDVFNSVSDTANVTIRVYKAPIAVNDVDTTLEDIPVLVDIVANDTAFGIGLNLGSVVIVANPANGTVENKNDGTVLYTPNSGFFGNDEFTYSISDHNGFVSNVAKVNIHVVQNTPDLLVVKTIATPISQIEVGGTVEFHIMLTNIGKEVATEVVVTDILADNLGGKNVRLEVENGSAFYDEATKTITWNISNLAVNESFMMKVFVQVTSGGDISNTASAKCKENDVIVSNNSSTAFADMTSKEDLFIPNVITVNGDGKNDNFQVLGLEKYPNAEFMVFNRWGSQVYESKDYKNNWDGIGLNEGTYYYVLKVNKYGVMKEYSGWVQVLR